MSLWTGRARVDESRAVLCTQLHDVAAYALSRPCYAEATTNPIVVIEVLSPSSEGDDDGDKRSDFQSLASLEAYVLVTQDQRRVKVYRRTASEWSVTTYRDGDSFELPTLSASIPVADVYDGILDSTGTSLLR